MTFGKIDLVVLVGGISVMARSGAGCLPLGECEC